MQRIVFVSLLWAFSFPVNKTWVAGADPVLVSFVRLALALLVLLPWLRAPRGGRGEIPRLLVIGAVQFGLMYAALNYCFVALEAYQVALFTVFTPLYVAGIHALRRRRAPPGLFAAALAALLGAALAERWQAPGAAFWRAFLAMQVSNAAFAWGQVAWRDWRRARPEEDEAAAFGWLYAGGALLCAAWALPAGNWGELLSYPAERWAALVYLGAVASGAGFYLWNTGAARVKAAELAALNNLKSPLAVLVSALFLGSAAGMGPLDWLLLGAGASLIGGASLAAGRLDEDERIPGAAAGGGRPAVTNRPAAGRSEE